MPPKSRSKSKGKLSSKTVRLMSNRLKSGSKISSKNVRPFLPKSSSKKYGSTSGARRLMEKRKIKRKTNTAARTIQSKFRASRLPSYFSPTRSGKRQRSPDLPTRSGKRQRSPDLPSRSNSKSNAAKVIQSKFRESYRPTNMFGTSPINNSAMLKPYSKSPKTTSPLSSKTLNKKPSPIKPKGVEGTLKNGTSFKIGSPVPQTARINTPINYNLSPVMSKSGIRLKKMLPLVISTADQYKQYKIDYHKNNAFNKYVYKVLQQHKRYLTNNGKMVSRVGNMNINGTKSTIARSFGLIIVNLVNNAYMIKSHVGLIKQINNLFIKINSLAKPMRQKRKENVGIIIHSILLFSLLSVIELLDDKKMIQFVKRLNKIPNSLINFNIMTLTHSVDQFSKIDGKLTKMDMINPIISHTIKQKYSPSIFNFF